MADSATTIPSSNMEEAAPPTEVTAESRPRPRQRGPPLNQIYALPAPIRTFPLPSFYPNNPISLFHLVYAWVKQALSPPPAEPSIIHTGIWDPASRSVHITDHAAVRALWEQGFYGKGSLSRSEPNWLKREQIRRGAVEGDVSEQRTAQRREERRQVKWERARTEQEALERTRREEAQLIADGDGNSTTDTATVSAAAPARQAEPELLTSKLESRGLLDEAILPEPSPVEAMADAFIDAVEEAVFDGPVAALTNADGKPYTALNGAAQEPGTQETKPGKLGTPDPVITDPKVRAASPGASPVAVSDAAVILETPLLLWKAPVGPLELLALPNCALSLPSATSIPPELTTKGRNQPAVIRKAPVGPLELLALPNSAAELLAGFRVTTVVEHAEVEQTVTVTDVEEAELDLPTSTAPAQAPAQAIVSKPVEPAPRSKSPVGPLELLALPNCLPVPQKRPAQSSGLNGAMANGIKPASSLTLPNGGPIQKAGTQDADASTVLPRQPVKTDAAGDESSRTNGHNHLNDHTNGPIFGDLTVGPVISEVAGSKRTIAVPDGPVEQPLKRRRKSVRFSTTVESTTFLHSDPPNPDRTADAKCNGTTATVSPVSTPREAALIPEEASAPEEKQSSKAAAQPASLQTSAVPDATPEIENKEHLQLSAEEAFFLSYGIGALSILNPDTRLPIPQEQLLALFRSHSYFPPRQDLGPNDPFLVHYAVYHHFRSLGWVPRHGIKFGVDWMLYTRGPVFDHAEFGLIVLPAYSHSWWKKKGVEAPRKSWHWLHGVNRVLSHVLKSLVLVYVDVPPPHVFDAAMAAGGVSAALKEYKVREFMVRRWSSNRNR